jgi:hypothetical protein
VFRSFFAVYGGSCHEFGPLIFGPPDEGLVASETRLPAPVVMAVPAVGARKVVPASIEIGVVGIHPRPAVARFNIDAALRVYGHGL